MKKILAMMVIVMMLAGCTGKSVANGTVMMEKQLGSKEWSEIEKTLDGNELSDVAYKFLDWVIQAYADENWDALEKTVDSYDAQMLGSSAALMSQIRTNYKEEKPKKIEAIDFSEYSDDETGEVVAWSMILAQTITGGVYEEEIFYAYHKDDKWTWSIMPMSFKNQVDIIMDDFEQIMEGQEQFNKELEEESEEFMEKYAETEAWMQQQMLEMENMTN